MLVSHHTNITYIASFPGPAQLSVASSTVKRGEPGIVSHMSMTSSKNGEHYTLGLMPRLNPVFLGRSLGIMLHTQHTHAHITLTHVTCTHVTHPLTHSHHTLTSHTSHTHITHTHR